MSARSPIGIGTIAETVNFLWFVYLVNFSCG